MPTFRIPPICPICDSSIPGSGRNEDIWYLDVVYECDEGHYLQLEDAEGYQWRQVMPVDPIAMDEGGESG